MVISWGLVYIYYRMVSCSGTAHVSVPFVFFFFLSFRMTTACLSWLERGTAHKVGYFYTCESWTTPAMPCQPVPHPLPSIPPAFPLLVETQHSPTPGPGSSGTQPPFCSRSDGIWCLPETVLQQSGPGGKSSDWERLLPSKIWLIDRNRALGEKNVNVRWADVSPKRLTGLTLLWTPLSGWKCLWRTSLFLASEQRSSL